MADENPNQPSRAEQIRIEAVKRQQVIVDALDKALKRHPAEQLSAFLHAFGLAFVWGQSYLPEIAAQLAEANSRDREAEIRAKNAEEFVAGIQEIARQQASGLVVPGAVQGFTTRRK